jgi:hypothetical protein
LNLPIIIDANVKNRTREVERWNADLREVSQIHCFRRFIARMAQPIQNIEIAQFQNLNM